MAKKPARKPTPKKTAKPARAAKVKRAPARKAKAAPKPAAKKTAAKRPRASAPAAAKATKKVTRPSRPPRVIPSETADESVVARTVTEKALTQAELNEFRSMLLAKRAQILGDVTNMQSQALDANRQDAAGDLSSMPLHMADIGSDNYELEFTLGLIEGERAILREIDEALERIDHGTYGVCLATGNPIGRARLKAKPWARYCYEYTLAQERGKFRGF